MVTGRFVRLELRRHSFGKKVGDEFVDVSLLVESDRALLETKLDPDKVVEITLVLDVPSLLELGGEVVVRVNGRHRDHRGRTCRQYTLRDEESPRVLGLHILGLLVVDAGLLRIVTVGARAPTSASSHLLTCCVQSAHASSC